MKLKDKIAVITGGNKGIGLSIARRYAREGATSVIVARDLQRSEAAAQEIAATGGKAFAVRCDLSDLADIDRMVATVVDQAGGIDILVNNAAVVDLRPLTEVTEAEWDYVFDINVKGFFFTLKAVAQQMIRQGRGGKIINVSSQAGRRGEAFVLVYGAAKAAVIHMNQTAALELIRYGINVNGIAPGVIDTEMWVTVDEQFGHWHGWPKGTARQKAEAAVPYGRFGRPDDLDGAAVFLASEESAYIIAQTINVDGGNWMS